VVGAGRALSRLSRGRAALATSRQSSSVCGCWDGGSSSGSVGDIGKRGLRTIGTFGSGNSCLGVWGKTVS
jgi:hypothetical protein